MAKIKLDTATVMYALLFIGVIVGISYVAMNLPGNMYEGFEEEPEEAEEDKEEFEDKEEAEEEEEEAEEDEEATGNEAFANMEMGQSDAAVTAMNPNAAPLASAGGAGGISAFDGETHFAPINGGEQMNVAQPNNPANCFPRDSLNPGELLPKEKSDYAAFQPMGQGTLAGRNFLEAGKLIGIDTVGQSLRNANYQLRSEPANPRVPVSVFNNSTIAPDATRRHLEIGSGN